MPAEPITSSFLYASLIAITAYLLVSILQLREIRQQQSDYTNASKTLALIGLMSHGFSNYLGILTDQGFDMGVYKVTSLVIWLMMCMSIIGIFRRRPIENISLFLYPLAAACIAAATFIESSFTPRDDWSMGLITHIILSINAYAILFVASFQAVSVAIQDRSLKTGQFTRTTTLLPPLQTMEAILFELIWLGFILLTAAILSGYIFLDDMFAQHVAHKTFISIIGWCIFATLLWGRHAKGWRGRYAVRWTLTGFTILMLAYFGSKFVLEVVLERGV